MLLAAQEKAGRQLASAASGTTTAAYAYDLNGIRTSKTVNGVTYDFLTQNGKVVRQTWGDNFMDFIYDNTGRPYAIVNGNSNEQAVYYYILNQQGDVIRVVHSSGTTVATYAYNAWGEVISSSGWMANQNPIRYRGYFQDTETGFYYLQSRYYDPSIGRFINADQFASTGQDFIGYNMFAYCKNNPIVNSDISGELCALAIGAIGIAASGLLGGVFAAANTMYSGGSIEEAAVSFLIGGTAAAATAGVAMLDLTIGAVALASFVIGATAEMCSMATDSCLKGQNYDYLDGTNLGQMAYAGVVNTVGGTLSKGINNNCSGMDGVFTSTVGSTGLGLCDFGGRRLMEVSKPTLSQHGSVSQVQVRKPSAKASKASSRGSSMNRSFMYV